MQNFVQKLVMDVHLGAESPLYKKDATEFSTVFIANSKHDIGDAFLARIEGTESKVLMVVLPPVPFSSACYSNQRHYTTCY